MKRGSVLVTAALLCVAAHGTSQQCLTPDDGVRPVSEGALASLRKSELQFSADLARTLATRHYGRNVFFSPASVFQALLLGYFVAANQTEVGLRTVLHLENRLDKLDYLGAYSLDNYYLKLRSIKKKGCQLNSSSRLYVAKSVKVQHCLRVLFSDMIQHANFLDNTDGVRRKINQWVVDQTNGVIKEFLSEDSLSSDSQLALLNAAYFKCGWKTEFDKKDTFQGDFSLLNGSTVNCTMMAQENSFKLRVDQKLEAEVLELPYKDEDISMFVILPVEATEEALQRLLQKIEGSTLQEMVNAMKADDIGFGSKVSVTLPKFTLEESIELARTLEKMGVGDLFQETADLSTLSGSKGPKFTEAVHKAKIKVDEKGTEAAAATALVEARMSLPSFYADHPFVYILFDKATDKLLFFGVFNSPPST